MGQIKLLSVGHDAKTIKGQKKGYLTGILYLAPHNIAGGGSICKFSTAGCRRVCLYSAGRGGFTSVQQARIRKTRFYLEDPDKFVTILVDDIDHLIKSAGKKGMTPCVRLNGTSDILWEKEGIIQKFPDLQFYDYTKYPPHLRQELPKNYHLTYSLSEKPISEQWAAAWQQRGVNTAVVFMNKLPHLWKGWTVINGDESDLRFTDPKGVVVGLKVKGKARKDDGDGFARTV